MVRERKAQNVLEYVLVVTAITLAVIAATIGIGRTGGGATGNAPGGALTNGMVMDAVNQMYSDATELIERETTSFLHLGAGSYYDDEDDGETNQSPTEPPLGP